MDKKVIKIFSLILIVIFSAGLFLNKWDKQQNDELLLNILSVGQGQSIIAQMPDGNNIIFDTGSLYIKDTGRKIVLPFLNYKGIKKIESMVISHDDIDHTNGVFEVTEGCEVENIYLDDDFITNSNTSTTAKTLIRLLEQNHQTIKSLGKIIHTDSMSKVTLLWPNEKARENKSLSDNDKSSVILIDFADKKILLCSDIEKYAQEQLLKIYPDLKCDIIVVPHHGSQTTLLKEFIAEFDGKIMIISSGRKDNKINKDSDNQKEKWFNTAIDGCVEVKINKEGKIKIETFSKP